jgi:hypothetical protein
MPWSYNANDGAGTWDGVKNQLKAFRDAHADLVDYTTATIVARSGQTNVKRIPPFAQCVFSASRITLPEGMQGIGLFDIKGRLLWSYQRPDGITGTLQIAIPKQIAKTIIFAKYK